MADSRSPRAGLAPSRSAPAPPVPVGRPTRAEPFAPQPGDDLAQDDALALAAYDLRPPLTTIAGTARLLARVADELAPEVRQELLDDLVQECARLDQRLAALLTRIDGQAGRRR